MTTMSSSSPDPAPLSAVIGAGAADASPDAADTAGTVSPLARRGLLPSLAITSLVLFATYSGLVSVLLPNQVANIDPANKVATLAIVTTTSFVFTLFAQPIVGAFSDRTRSRMGRRAPWMVIGTAVAAAFLIGLGSLQSILWITVFWVVIQVALNAMHIGEQIKSARCHRYMEEFRARLSKVGNSRAVTEFIESAEQSRLWTPNLVGGQ